MRVFSVSHIRLTRPRTGKYKVLTSSGLAFACLGYALIAWRWRGDTTWAESLYIFPGGFGMGVAGSTTFIALTAGVPSADLAVAGAGIYQAMGIGAALGSCVTMSILQTALRPMLSEALRKINASKEVGQIFCGEASTDVDFRSLIVP